MNEAEALAFAVSEAALAVDRLTPWADREAVLYGASENLSDTLVECGVVCPFVHRAACTAFRDEVSRLVPGFAFR